MAKILQGIPRLLWVEMPALSFLGEPVDYRYLMGASGPPEIHAIIHCTQEDTGKTSRPRGAI
jgi:hypothetical protein